MPHATTFDHLVYGVPDLIEGVHQFAAATGVEPSVGGRHAGFGTANYLVGLGGDAYLEIIGPDPDSPDAPARRPFGVAAGNPPGLLTWAVRSTDIDAGIALARSRGYDPGDAATMSRRTASGDLLQWRLTPDTVRQTGGVLPFLIDWGHSRHPTGNPLPQLEVAAFAVQCPEPDGISRHLAALGVRVGVELAASPGLRAVLGTPNGAVVLAAP